MESSSTESIRKNERKLKGLIRFTKSIHDHNISIKKNSSYTRLCMICDEKAIYVDPAEHIPILCLEHKDKVSGTVLYDFKKRLIIQGVLSNDEYEENNDIKKYMGCIGFDPLRSLSSKKSPLDPNPYVRFGKYNRMCILCTKDAKVKSTEDDVWTHCVEHGQTLKNIIYRIKQPKYFYSDKEKEIKILKETKPLPDENSSDEDVLSVKSINEDKLVLKRKEVDEVESCKKMKLIPENEFIPSSRNLGNEDIDMHKCIEKNCTENGSLHDPNQTDFYCREHYKKHLSLMICSSLVSHGKFDSLEKFLKLYD